MDFAFLCAELQSNTWGAGRAASFDGEKFSEPPRL